MGWSGAVLGLGTEFDMADVKVNIDDWDYLKNCALFAIPRIVENGRLANDDPERISAQDINSASLELGVKVSQNLARNALLLRPLSYIHAERVLTTYNAAAKKKNPDFSELTKEMILAFVFRVKKFNELFSEEAIKKHDLDILPIGNLQRRTITNFFKGGRLTAYVVKIFLERFQEVYAAKFKGQDGIPEEIRDFIACKDLSDYATTDRAGHRAIQKDEGNFFLISKEDLKLAPKGWWNGQ